MYLVQLVYIYELMLHAEFKIAININIVIAEGYVYKPVNTLLIFKLV
jgi:hypothetical protein